MAKRWEVLRVRVPETVSSILTQLAMAMSIEEAQAKARSYGRGEIPITRLPPATLYRSKGGVCDYCGQKRPVVMPTKTTLYLVCWRCICQLKELHGEDWELKAESRLMKNRQLRLQTNARNLSKKKGDYGVQLTG